MKIPIRRLLKRDVVWLAEHRCEAHGKDFLGHYTCFVRESPDTSPLKEKIGVFDLESTGLVANWSHMLCWCMKDRDTGEITHDLITTKEARDKNDKRLIKSAVNEIKKYDRIIGWYSSRFDIPYVRSKAIYHKIEFPAYKDLYHTDLYYACRSKMRLHSNRLQSFCEYLGIPAKGHRMTPELNMACGRGDKEALEVVLLHCREDVDSTLSAFEVLLKHMLIGKQSI